MRITVDQNFFFRSGFDRRFPDILIVKVDLVFRLVSAIEINPGEYSGRISGDDTIDKWYKFERPNTYFNQIKEQVKQHVSTLESFESLDQPL